MNPRDCKPQENLPFNESWCRRENSFLLSQAIKFFMSFERKALKLSQQIDVIKEGKSSNRNFFIWFWFWWCSWRCFSALFLLNKKRLGVLFKVSHQRPVHFKNRMRKLSTFKLVYPLSHVYIQKLPRAFLVGFYDYQCQMSPSFSLWCMIPTCTIVSWSFFWNLTEDDMVYDLF